MYKDYLKSKKPVRPGKTQNADESTRVKPTEEGEDDSATDNDDQSHGGDESWEEAGSESNSNPAPVTKAPKS